MLPQSQYTPSLRFEKIISSIVLQSLLWCTVPVITVALNRELFFNESEIKIVVTDGILLLWIHAHLLKSIFHFVFDAAYAFPAPALDSTVMLATPTAILLCAARMTGKFFIAIKTQASFTLAAYLSLAFVTAILSIYIVATYKFLAAQLAYVHRWRFALFSIPSTPAMIIAKLRISLDLPGSNAEDFMALFALTNRATLAVFAFPNAPTLSRAELRIGVRSRWSKSSFKRSAALFADMSDRMSMHGNLSFLCHAPGCTSTAGAQHFYPHYTINRLVKRIDMMNQLCAQWLENRREVRRMQQLAQDVMKSKR